LDFPPQGLRTRTPLAVSLGSNLGDRAAHLHFAIARLARFLTDLRVSTFIETEPVGVGPQPLFLNAAATAQTPLDAPAVLETLLAIERDRGRTRPHQGAPRTLDLDLILFGNHVIDRPGLHVPHPRFRERRFVLQPLSEIGPRMVDPVTGLTVSELLARLDDAAKG